MRKVLHVLLRRQVTCITEVLELPHIQIEVFQPPREILGAHAFVGRVEAKRLVAGGDEGAAPMVAMPSRRKRRPSVAPASM